MLAQQAYAELTVPEPLVRAVPAGDQFGSGQYGGLPYTFVGLQTWVWAVDWQPLQRTVDLRGVSATVTATPTALVFDPGNGDAPVTCAGPGRPWTEADGNKAPTDGGCGYVYRSVTPTGPLTATTAISVVGGVDEQHRRRRHVPGADDTVVVLVPGGADSGGGAEVKASTTCRTA